MREVVRARAERKENNSLSLVNFTSKFVTSKRLVCLGDSSDFSVASYQSASVSMWATLETLSGVGE